MKTLKEALLKESLFSKKNLDVVNKYGISKKDMIGQLKGFPVGVVVRMMEEQEAQRGDANIKQLQISRCGGFSWGKTEKGHIFWSDVLLEEDFDLFFEEYPEYKKYN